MVSQVEVDRSALTAQETPRTLPKKEALDSPTLHSSLRSSHIE